MSEIKLTDTLRAALEAPEGVSKECHHLASGANVLTGGLKSARLSAMRLTLALVAGRAPENYNPREDVARLAETLNTFAEVADDFAAVAAKALNLTGEQIRAEMKRQGDLVAQHIASLNGDPDALDEQPGQDQAANEAGAAIAKAMKGGDTIH